MAIIGGITLGFDIIRGNFKKDLLLLVVVTIVLGSLLAGAGSRLSYRYFNQAVSGLIGEYGEYDIIVHVRPEFAQAAEDGIRELFRTEYPGSRIRQGVTVAGSANFLAAFPQRLLNRRTFQDLNRLLPPIPGYNGNTLIIEPRVTVKGVPEGLVPLLSGEIDGIRGVSFHFPNNGVIEVVLTGEGYRDSVTESLNRLLGRYRIVEARLPMGVSFPDRERVGNAVVEGIQRNFGVIARDLGYGSEERSQGLVRTLDELKGFLLGYVSSIRLGPGTGREWAKGDYVVLSERGIRPGSVIGNLPVAQVYSIDGEGAVAIPVRGELADIMKGRTKGVVQGNLLEGNELEASLRQPKAGKEVGPVTVSMRRMELLAAVRETQILLGQFDESVALAETTLGDLSKTLSGYGRNLEALENLRGSLGTYEKGLGEALIGYSRIDADALRELTVKQSALVSRIGGYQERLAVLLATLGRIRDDLVAQRGKLNATIAALPNKGTAFYALAGYRDRLNGAIVSIQDEINGVNGLVTENRPLVLELTELNKATPGILLDLANVKNEIRRINETRNTVRKVLQSVESVVEALRGIDILSLNRDVGDALFRVNELEKVNASVILDQLRLLERSLPDISDLDIGRSLTLLDTYLSGQVIPGERILVLTGNSVPDSYVAQVIRERTGEDRITVLSTAAGEVQSDLRANVLGILVRVRAIIAAFIALLIVLFSLVTDHATVIAAQRAINSYKGRVSRGRRRSYAGSGTLVYGTVVGFVMTVSMAYASGAELFSLPPLAMGLIGGVLGLWAAVYGERLSPVDGDEVMAGESMGFTIDEVMRRIVIPSGRLGLLTLLNKRYLRI